MKNGMAQLARRRGFNHLGLIWLIGCLTAGGALIAKGITSSPEPAHVLHTKAIEDIKVGDYVLAKDPNDLGLPTPRKVTGVPRNYTLHIVHVKVMARESSIGEVQATREHPFYTLNRGWVNAKDLLHGDLLMDESDRPIKVSSTSIEDIETNTYNLTVDGVHTFYVLAGQSAVLVHNTIVVTPGGTAVVIPNGATGPVPVINGSGNTTGFGYTGGSGGNGMSGNVSNVRIMDPTAPRGPSPGYPNGYVNYSNPSGQSVNQQTGRTVGKNDPFWHQPCK